MEDQINSEGTLTVIAIRPLLSLLVLAVLGHTTSAHVPIVPRDRAAETAGDLSAAAGAIALVSLAIFFILDKTLDALVRQGRFYVGFWAGKAYVGTLTLCLAVVFWYVGVTLPYAASSARRAAALAQDNAATLIVATPVTPEQRRLFLVPGGAYTAADIAANGGQTPDQKWRGMMANHHLNAKRGAIVCPITLTQANPKFPWIVGGKKYLFCCPPCVAEFVRGAKKNPHSLKAPEIYVQK